MMQGLKRFVESGKWDKILKLVDAHFQEIKNNCDNIKPIKIESEHENCEIYHFEPIYDQNNALVFFPKFKVNPLAIKNNKLKDCMRPWPNFEIIISKEGNNNIKIKRDNFGLFLEFENSNCPEWYDLKFDHDKIKGASFYEFADKLIKTAKEMKIGVEIKDLNIKEGNIETASDNSFHIYPRFESGLSENEVIKKFADFYLVARKNGINIQMNKSEGKTPIKTKVLEELKRRNV